ncbi:hypothetical protein [Streptomyces sp. ATMOS53]
MPSIENCSTLPSGSRNSPSAGSSSRCAPGTGEQRQNHQVARRERVDAGARLDNPADTLAAEDQRERWPPELAPDDLEVVQVQR